MASAYSYLVTDSNLDDLLLGTKVYNSTDPIPVLDNPTRNFTVSNVVATGITNHVSGTVDRIPVFTDTNVIGDSIIYKVGDKISVGENLPAWDHGPDGKLQVNTSNDTTALKLDIAQGEAVYSFSGNSTSGYLTYFKMDNIASYIGHDSSIRDLRFQTFGTDKMVIKPNGNIGINTTTPSEKLDVSGNIRATSYIIGANQGMSLFSYTNSLHVYSPDGTDIQLGGGIGNRNNDVIVGNGKLSVKESVEVTNNASGLILRSPNGTRYELTVLDNGTLQTTLV